MPVGKQQLGVSVLLPEAAQRIQSCCGQGHKAVAVALGVANLHAGPLGINVGHAQEQTFTEAQARLYRVKKNTR